jgi:hypothetical protein
MTLGQPILCRLLPVVAKIWEIWEQRRMARRTLRILPYKGSRDYHYYLDGLKVNGKRKRLFFTTEAEASGPKRAGISYITRLAG